jgi:hypothetical protein
VLQRAAGTDDRPAGRGRTRTQISAEENFATDLMIAPGCAELLRLAPARA